MRQDVGMLQKEQRVGNAIGLALFDQPALQLEPVRVGDEAEPPHLERLSRHTCAGSKFSMPFLTSAMNWSATAPSTRRWS